MFHLRCGERVKLSNDNKTASRNVSEFNYGLVFSSEPIVDNELFEIRIDKKVIMILIIYFLHCRLGLLTVTKTVPD